MVYRQEAPFAVQVEFCEGCNLRCTFCGLNGIRQPKVNDFKFMSSKTLASLMSQIVENGWNPRMEIAMHGEPTMHPDLVNMIKLMRDTAPTLQIMMTSNGGGLLTSTGRLITSMFAAGLNTLALDDYDGIKIVPKIRSAWTKYEMECDAGNASTGVKVYEYPENPDGSPHARRSLKEKSLIFIADISKVEDGKGNHSLLNNHAGAGAPKNDNGMGKRCAKPFRELSVRYDGSVAVCCNDWRGEYKCGNVNDGLMEVWDGDAMYAARQKLIRGERDFGPCLGCDATSYRTGLLPDKKGKETMPRPNAVTMARIAVALRGEPYAVPVLRPWEVES